MTGFDCYGLWCIAPFGVCLCETTVVPRALLIGMPPIRARTFATEFAMRSYDKYDKAPPVTEAEIAVDVVAMVRLKVKPKL